ncbi:MAG: 3-phosphoshikimate 1-carboxyvinyltransferase [Eubacteriales bacterium]
MDISISPARLNGEIEAVESKSDAHRLLICAALSHNPTEIYIKNISKDIAATINCLTEMGCFIENLQANKILVHPLWARIAENPCLDCGESGSTLRFLLPVAAALYSSFTIIGSGRLPERPLTPIIDAMKANGCNFDSDILPIKVTGKLNSGKFTLPGDVSSQFISGLLFALPMLEGTSELVLTSPLESSGYVDMTIDTLKKFGVSVVRGEKQFIIAGGQKYISPGNTAVEGDWSNAAFWLAAGAMNGKISCNRLDRESLQSDRKIFDILKRMGSEITFENGTAQVENKHLFAINLDASDIPDLVPIMAAVMAVADGISIIKNAGRVRFKESDRLHAIAKNLNLIGAEVEELEDSLVIRGKQKLSGGITDGCNDHRIVMALAAVSVACEGEVIIKGSQAIEKSYPDFFNDFKKLGGLAHVI